jgi:hypothetical protein
MDSTETPEGTVIPWLKVFVAVKPPSIEMLVLFDEHVVDVAAEASRTSPTTEAAIPADKAIPNKIEYIFILKK